MNLQIRIVAIADNGQQQVYEIASLQRTELKMETLGLTLAEGKTILCEIQRVVVERQVAECLEPYRHCSACGQPQHGKGQHDLPMRTVFGKMKIPSPRIVYCDCHLMRPRASVLWRNCCPSEPRRKCCFWRPNGRL